MAYTLTSNEYIIVRDEDQAFIPVDESNLDYLEYLAWLDEGNQPNPAPEIVAPIRRPPRR
jgi:hypothetical protein